MSQKIYFNLVNVWKYLREKRMTGEREKFLQVHDEMTMRYRNLYCKPDHPVYDFYMVYGLDG